MKKYKKVFEEIRLKFHVTSTKIERTEGNTKKIDYNCKKHCRNYGRIEKVGENLEIVLRILRNKKKV